jgi:acetyl esterase
MPLDPQAQALLDMMAAADAPPMTEQTPEEARAAMAMMSAVAGAPEKRARTEDRSIPGPHGDIPVRIYRPEGDGPFPLVVFFHGGGFVIGDLDSHDLPCHNIATSVPAVVMAVHYRLAPEARFPGAVEDCWAATQWAAAHGDDLGADASRLAVMGDSAGGNLAAVVAIKARDAGGPEIAFQCLVYPATDLTRTFASHQENGQGYLLTSEMMDWFMNHYFGDDMDLLSSPDASPYFVEDLSGLPPALVITAEYDPLRDEGEAYAKRLREAGIEATTTRYDGMIHGFFGLDGLFDASKKATAEAISALQKATG